MNVDVIIIIFLIAIILLLIFLIFRIKLKNISNSDLDIQRINQNLQTLFDKTVEQTGYVNSKIDEIGNLTKKMNNAMT